ncbi:MAG: transposase [Lachnospiraceae bacterium]|nr:transposase [Lachnospiraceae bacterium]
MPRQARCFSEGNYFHVMIRGINKQAIFLDDADRRKFLKTILRFAEETNVDILAWCLMSNHVHLLLKAEGLPDLFMKKIGCSYVPYFNKKYGRVGHLFQDRYKSETIRDDRYMLAVVRYIHMNPENANICKMSDYKWSSYNEYVTGGELVHTDLILNMLGGVDGYTQFMETTDKNSYMDIDEHSNLSEKEIQELFSKLFPAGKHNIQRLLPSERSQLIVSLCEAGLTAAQISHVTGLGKNVVYSVLKGI